MPRKHKGPGTLQQGGSCRPGVPAIWRTAKGMLQDHSVDVSQRGAPYAVDIVAGGAVYVDVPDATSIHGCNFTSNRAAGNAGALVVWDLTSNGSPLASLNITCTRFIGNQAVALAGAVYVSCVGGGGLKRHNLVVLWMSAWDGELPDRFVPGVHGE
jgi:hypothetical protein